MTAGLLLAGFAVAPPLVADGDTGAPPAAPAAENRPRFGPFEALVFDRTYLQDVKIENGRIYLKRQPNHRNEAITLRNSMAHGEAYRKWFNGGYDLVSPANAWTDWVETTANYVEYWIGDTLILHLHRVGS